MIGLHGSRDRKVHASYLLFFYTLFGSLLMLISIFLVYLHIGTTNFIILSGAEFSSVREYMLWFTFFVSFAVKIPMFPFHIWLPEAHVESPTEGSVILAAILLKVGGYGFLRILLPMFPIATIYYSSFVILLCIISIIYTSMSTIRQTDIKRVIAYSSIAHMNVALLGIMLLTPISISGSLLLMLGHGIVSGGLFLMIGMLYDRFKTKVITYYSGIVYTMPLYSGLLFLFVLGNISMPSTANFVGEFLILMSAFSHCNVFCLVAVAISIFICSFYSLYLYNRIIFGIPMRARFSNDITLLEFYTLLPILCLLFIIGTYPKPFIDVIYSYSSLLSVQYIT
jgi:proton-translocating NADH-quinone oxidoreductase chain M